MAIQSICGKLFAGLDVSCEAPIGNYYQQAVVINKSDILSYTITTPTLDTCEYNVEFTLKPGTTGYRFVGPEAGSNYFGSVDKSRNDLGYPTYVHNVQILIAGVTEESKCIVDSLDKGSFVVALQLKDGTVEIYGMINGLTTGDYTYNVQEGGGGTPILLSSPDTARETRLPLVYKPTSGDATADFDSLFENPSTP